MTVRKTANSIIEDTKLRQFLLGQLDRENEGEVEGLLFTNEEIFDQCGALEHDLIDAYIRNELTEAERQLFERRFLTNPEQLSKVKVAFALKHELLARSKTHAYGHTFRERALRLLGSGALSWRQPVFASAIVVLVAVALVVVFFRSQRLPTSSDNSRIAQKGQGSSSSVPLQVQPESAKPSRPPVMPDTNQSSAFSGTIQAHGPKRESASKGAPKIGADTAHQGSDTLAAILTLSPNVSRGISDQEEPTLTLKQGKYVMLVMRTKADPYRYYRCVLRTAQGAEVEKVSTLRQARNGDISQISFRLSTDRLAAGSYVVMLLGSNDKVHYSELDEYSFEAI